MSEIEQGATVVQGLGDGVTAIGYVTLQPEIVVAGEAIGAIGSGIEMINNLIMNRFSIESIVNNSVKFGIQQVFGILGKKGVEATRTVAGEKAVDAGANAISEAIIGATTNGTGKDFEKAVENKIKEENGF